MLSIGTVAQVQEMLSIGAVAQVQEVLSISAAASTSGMGPILCYAVFITCLLTASVCDIRTHLVPDLIWWIAAIDIVSLIAVRYGCGDGLSDADVLTAAGCLLEALFVIFIQERVMSRYYGRADSHAFSCCALFFAACGSCFEAHIVHMSMSLFFLVIIQTFRGNIGRRCRLRNPVPFIPYISLSFILGFIFL
ncbi:MAG: hypothetical protein J6U50_03040 [Lachnospiraceae bacterium]|nr:hypothetical protein [Lachnospiraceae bacterium]